MEDKNKMLEITDAGKVFLLEHDFKNLLISNICNWIILFAVIVKVFFL